jgi:hypothetical protein
VKPVSPWEDFGAGALDSQLASLPLQPGLFCIGQCDFKRAWHERTQELILLLCHGVLAPRAGWRTRVIVYRRHLGLGRAGHHCGRLSLVFVARARSLGLVK